MAFKQSDYEKMRDENVRERMALLEKLEINQTKQNLVELSANPRKEPVKRRHALKADTDAPRRRSSRNHEVVYSYVFDRNWERSPAASPNSKNRNSNPIQSYNEVNELLENKSDQEPVKRARKKPSELTLTSTMFEGETGLHKLAELGITTSELNSDNNKSLMSSLKDLQLREYHVTKVTKNKIHSVVLHPGGNKVLVCAGDRHGCIGLWNVDMKFQTLGEVCQLEPHIDTVSCLGFSPHCQTKLLSCSHDGTLGCVDLQHGAFTQIYLSPEEEGIGLTLFASTSPNTVCVSRTNGSIITVDLRTSQSVMEFAASTKRVKTVSCHPTNQNYILTAGTIGTCHIWDLRYLKSKTPKSVSSLNHPLTLSSAFFSPMTGNWILTTCMDHTVRLYDSSTIDNISPMSVIKHNNKTGRWLTPFKATWHPSSEDVFVVGSLDHPRKADLFFLNGSKSPKHHTLRSMFMDSVVSVNAFHSTLPVLACANSSGRVHLFSDPSFEIS